MFGTLQAPGAPHEPHEALELRQPHEHPDYTAGRELEAQITELAGNVNAATARLVSLIDELDATEAWGRNVGCLSPTHWLSWRCGIAPAAARELLSVARKLRDLPEVAGAFAAGRLSLSQVRALAGIARPETESDLLSVALSCTADQLSRFCRMYRWGESLGADARRARYLRTHFDEDGTYCISGRLAPEDGAVVEAALNAAQDELEAAPGDPEEVTVHGEHAATRADALVALVEAGITATPERSRPSHEVSVHVDLATFVADADGRAVIAPGVAIDPQAIRRIGCDSALLAIVERDGEPLSVGRRTRSIPPRLRRALHARDEGCRWPGCANRRFTDGHHVRHWSDGGETSLSNLLLLCKRHHRMVHDDGFEVRPRDGTFEFFDPRGTPVPAARAPAGGDLDGLYRDNIDNGLEIDRDTCVPQWDGTPMSEYVVDVFLANHHRRDPSTV